MIYIIDNGGNYSDHHLHFVESDIAPDDMARIVAMQDGPSAGIIGTADKIEWRKGTTGHIGTYVTICSAHFEHENQWPPRPPQSRAQWVLTGARERNPFHGDEWPTDLLALIVAEIDARDPEWRTQFGRTAELWGMHKAEWPAMAREALGLRIASLRAQEVAT